MKKRIVSLALSSMMLCAMGCGSNGSKKGNTGNEFNYSELPFYLADQNLAKYDYDNEKRVRPYWMGNVIYNETVMFKKTENGISANLLYEPKKIISVYDWTLKVCYEEGKDYTVENGMLKIAKESRIPIFEDGWAYGQNIPNTYQEVNDLGVTGNKYQLFDCSNDNGDTVKVIYTEGPLIYSNTLNVSYVYDPAVFDYSKTKTYSGELNKLNEKLNKGEDIKMVVFGDSISEGCSSSGHWNREPGTPFYGDLIKNELERIYDSKIQLFNMSKGGKTSSWGAGLDNSDNGGDNLRLLKEQAPDFLIIGFGANDAGAVSAENFALNISSIANAAREANPDCSIVFLSTAAFNPYFVKRNKQVALRNSYKEVSYLYDNSSFVDMYDLTLSMYQKKETYELLANNLNHPNDFLHRVFAMNILNAIVDYKALNK